MTRWNAFAPPPTRSPHHQPERLRVSRTSFISVLAVSVVAAACSSTATGGGAGAGPAPAAGAGARGSIAPTGATANATLHDAAGRKVGTVAFSETYAGLLVRGEVSDLGLGAHGIHLHSVGKCEAPFTTAGGHFNPEQRVHGFKSQHGHHLGDMPNIVTPAAGKLDFEFLVPGVSLKGVNAILDADGASIVVHASADDYTTDPAGNSGARVACGVIAQ
jgi:superoxide dismutase, Cu-Zn family